MEPDTAQPISVKLDPAKGEVVASFTPTENAEPITVDTIHNIMAEKHYDKFAINKEAIDTFVENCQKATEPIKALIALRKDGEFTLTMSEDKMQLALTLVPPKGGHPKAVEVIKAIQQMGVKHGLKHDELREAIRKGECENQLVAEGTWPVLGNPVEFRNYLEELEQKLSEVDEDAFIKYSDLGHLLLVKPGDKLMRRIPPVPGKDGVDLMGNMVPTRPLVNANFNASCSGTKFDENDPDLLLAAISGQPKLISNGVKVNNVIEIENIDLSTGNVDFEGTIHIAGDVKSGMKLHATGDIFINGMIEAAEVIAGGDISVKGGIIGSAETQSNNTPQTEVNLNPNVKAAIVSQHGSVQAMFAQNMSISARKAILITGNCTQCDMRAGEEIIVGKEKSLKNGQIIGGMAQAMKLVKAVSIGSHSAGATKLILGDDPTWGDKVYEKEKEISAKTDEFEMKVKLLNHLRQEKKKKPESVKDADIAKTDAERAELIDHLKVLNMELQKLKEDHIALEDVRVQVLSELYEGTEIRIGRYKLLTTSDMGKGVARLQGDRIAFGK